MSPNFLVQVYERMGLRGLRELRDRKFRPGHNKRRPQRNKRRKPNVAVITEVEYDIYLRFCQNLNMYVRNKRFIKRYIIFMSVLEE